MVVVVVRGGRDVRRVVEVVDGVVTTVASVVGTTIGCGRVGLVVVDADVLTRSGSSSRLNATTTPSTNSTTASKAAAMS